jgi:hypothetical protein
MKSTTALNLITFIIIIIALATLSLYNAMPASAILDPLLPLYDDFLSYNIMLISSESTPLLPLGGGGEDNIILEDNFDDNDFNTTIWTEFNHDGGGDSKEENQLLNISTTYYSETYLHSGSSVYTVQNFSTSGTYHIVYEMRQRDVNAAGSGFKGLWIENSSHVADHVNFDDQYYGSLHCGIFYSISYDGDVDECGDDGCVSIHAQDTDCNAWDGYWDTDVYKNDTAIISLNTWYKVNVTINWTNNWTEVYIDDKLTANGTVNSADVAAIGDYFKVEWHMSEYLAGQGRYAWFEIENVTIYNVTAAAPPANVPPSWALNTTNSTSAGSDIEHRVRWQDDTALSGYIFSFCDGSWNGSDCINLNELPGNQADGWANMNENVMLLHLNNDSSFGENDTHVYDFSDGVNNGSVVDAVWVSNGKLGGAFDFNGTDGYIDVGNDSSLNFSDNFSVGVWFNNTGWGSKYDPVIMRNDADFNKYWYLSVGTSGTVSFVVGNATVECSINSPTAISLDTWHHAVGTFNGTGCSLYLNGTLIANEINPVTNFSATDKNVYVGADMETNWESSNVYYFNGTIDEVSVWNRTLSAEEVLNIYDRQKGGFINDSFVSMTGTNNWSNVTKSVNSTAGANMAWRVYANDSDGEWNTTDIFIYTTDYTYHFDGDYILEDATFDESLTLDGTENYLKARELDGDGNLLTIIFDISALPSGANISNATLCFMDLNAIIGSTESIELWRASNKSWTEPEIDAMCGDGAYCSDFETNGFFTESLANYTGAGTGTDWECTPNISSAVVTEYSANSDNISFTLNFTGTEAAGTDYYYYYSKDAASNMPYLNITLDGGTIPVDRTAPALDMNESVSDTNIIKDNEALYFYAEWYSNETIQNCILEVDGTNYTGTARGSVCSRNMTSMSPGNYSFTGYAADYYGNTNKTDLYWVRLRNGTLDGYWLFRAPVNETHEDDGITYPCRYANTGVDTDPCGNGQDVGVLWRNSTLDEEGFLLRDEERHCGAWGQFYFDEPNITADHISTIYCHIWAYTDSPSGMYYGVAIDGSYDLTSYLDKHFYTASNTYLTNATNYYLITYYNNSFDYSFTTNETFWNISLKVSGTNIQILSYPNQRSFCIINYDNGTLGDIDTDGDGLTDEQEMYTTHTDPYDSDTDNDTRSDLYEYNNNKDGWDPYDWGVIHKYRINSSAPQISVYVKTLNDQPSKPAVEPYNSTLSRELTADEYDNLTNYTENNIVFKQNTTNDNRWSLMQLNYHYNITQDMDGIINLNVFEGSEVSVTGSNMFNDTRVIRIFNTTDGGRDPPLPGKKGTTKAFFLKQIRDNFTEVINETDKMLYLRKYMRLNSTGLASTHSMTTRTYWSEVWVTMGGSEVNITQPLEADPLSTSNGSNITVNFTLTEDGAEIVSDVDVMNITINGTICTLLTSDPWYDTDHWEQNCTVPDKEGGYYNLTIWANTSTSGLLTDTEENAVHYIGDYVSYAYDVFTYNEMIDKAGFFTRHPTDSTTFTEAHFTLSSMTRYVTESMVMTEYPLSFAYLIRSATQSFTITDTAIKTMFFIIPVTSTFTMTDTPLRLSASLRSESDSIAYSDVPAKYQDLNRINTDSFTITEFPRRLSLLGRAISSSMNIYDTANSAKIFIRTGTSFMTATDSINRILRSMMEVSDSLTYNEQSRRVQNLGRLGIDQVSYNELPTRTRKLIRIITDSLTYYENAVGVRGLKLYVRTVTSSLSLIEQSLKEVFFYRSISNILTYDEQSDRQAHLFRFRNDTLIYDDSGNRLKKSIRTISDSFAYSENAVGQIISQLIQRYAYSSFSYTDMAVRGLYATRTVTNPIEIMELVTGTFPEKIVYEIIKFITDNWIMLILNQTDLYACGHYAESEGRCVYVGEV